MKIWQKVLGIEGLVLLIFGLLSYLFAPEAKALLFIFSALGLVLLAAFLIIGAPRISESFSKRSTRIGTMVATYSVVALLIVFALNLIAARHPKSLDLTSAKVNTLSDQSKKTLAQLEEPVEVIAFFKSEDAGGLKGLLSLYEQASKNFLYKIIDPDSEPQEAKKYGVSQYGVLVAVCGSRRNLFSGTNEEDITNAIIKVTRIQKGVVYFIEGHGENDVDSSEERGYSIIKSGLENENFRVQKLLLAQVNKIPDDAQAIAIVGPKKNYLTQEIALIEDYLASGGHLFVALEPDTNSELEELCLKYGVDVQNTMIIDQQMRLLQGPTLGIAPIVTEYGSHPAVKDLNQPTIFPTARSLKPVPASDPDLDISVIAKSSDTSWAETDVKRIWETGEVELNQSEDFTGPLPIAIAVTKKSEQENEGVKNPETRLVVVGDADFASNQYVSYYYNSDLFLNLVSWLTGEETFISIRPNRYAPSLVTLTTSQSALIFFLAVFLVPQLVIMTGIAVLLWRGKK